MHLHYFLFFAIFSLFSPVFPDDGFYQGLGCCTFRGPHFEDVEYTLKLFFNNVLVVEFNSTRGYWRGFTEYSIPNALQWNTDHFDELTRAVEKAMLCENIVHMVQYFDALASAPTIRLTAVKQSSMLVCSAYNFYPKQIEITWLRNGQKVHSAVSFSEVMPNTDWSYQIHSYLEFSPTHGGNITCMVEHYSLSEPALVVWDPSLPVAQRIQIAVGLCGLMLGFAVLVCGLIYYKKKSAAYETVCQGRVMIPVELLPADGAS